MTSTSLSRMCRERHACASSRQILVSQPAATACPVVMVMLQLPHRSARLPGPTSQLGVAGVNSSMRLPAGSASRIWRPSGTRDNVAPEGQSGAAQALDLAVEIVNGEVDAVATRG